MLEQQRSAKQRSVVEVEADGPVPIREEPVLRLGVIDFDRCKICLGADVEHVAIGAKLFVGAAREHFCIDIGRPDRSCFWGGKGRVFITQQTECGWRQVLIAVGGAICVGSAQPLPGEAAPVGNKERFIIYRISPDLRLRWARAKVMF